MDSPEKTKSAAGKTALYRLLPSWKGNLAIFGGLVALVLAAMYWQVRQAQSAYLDHVRLTTRVLASVIQRNAENTVLSQAVVERIIGTFLENTARFVDYLNNIQRFSGDELAAFAEEAGLAGIKITEPGKSQTEGPAGWLPEDALLCTGDKPSLLHLPAAHMYCLTFPRTTAPGCIVVGIGAVLIEKLQDQIGLPQLLKAMEKLTGISYIRVEENAESDGKSRLINKSGLQVAEERLPLDSSAIVIGMDARQFFIRIGRLQREFAVFSIILAALGVFLSWLLYRFQSTYLKRMQAYERELARQREDATLGRATAAIAHEIRNPLNAISMGLQRLHIEAEGLPEEHHALIATMRNAVTRTDAIIGDIRRFAKPLAPRYQPVALKKLVDRTVLLYERPCREQRLEISVSAETDTTLWADPNLLEQALENLVKNAVEAQPEGGFLKIAIHRREPHIVLVAENAGFHAPAKGIEKILEPYFTTKTRGTGLGLSNTRRIIEAHAGTITLDSPEKGVLRITVNLPLKTEGRARFQP